MERTCGEASEIEKFTHPKKVTALFQGAYLGRRPEGCGLKSPCVGGDQANATVCLCLCVWGEMAVISQQSLRCPGCSNNTAACRRAQVDQQASPAPSAVVNAPWPPPAPPLDRATLRGSSVRGSSARGSSARLARVMEAGADTAPGTTRATSCASSPTLRAPAPGHCNHEKGRYVIRVGIILGFVRLTTRAPHGGASYVRGDKRHTIDPHGGRN